MWSGMRGQGHGIYYCYARVWDWWLSETWGSSDVEQVVILGVCATLGHGRTAAAADNYGNMESSQVAGSRTRIGIFARTGSSNFASRAGNGPSPFGRWECQCSLFGWWWRRRGRGSAPRVGLPPSVGKMRVARGCVRGERGVFDVSSRISLRAVGRLG